MESILDRVNRCGFSLQKNAFDPSALDAIRACAVSYFETVTGETGHDWGSMNARFFDFCEKTPEKRRFLYNALQLAPELVSLAVSERMKEHLASAGVSVPILKNTNLRIDIPSHSDFFLIDWHQDLNNLDAERSYTIWMPLHDLDEETGALRVLRVPEFERKRQPVRRTEGGYDQVLIDEIPGGKEEAVFPQYGDALFFDPYLVHASLRGKSKVRWTLIMRFDDLATFYDVTGRERLSERQITPDPYLKARGGQEMFGS